MATVSTVTLAGYQASHYSSSPRQQRKGLPALARVSCRIACNPREPLREAAQV